MKKSTPAQKLTQEKLKELLEYDSKTGIFTWRHGVSARRSGSNAGGLRNDGYRQIRVDGNYHYEHRLVWLYEYGYFPENIIDHKDRDKANNNLSNLREVSQSCNMRNASARVDNTSGVKGVKWRKKNCSWESTIGCLPILRNRTGTVYYLANRNSRGMR